MTIYYCISAILLHKPLIRGRRNLMCLEMYHFHAHIPVCGYQFGFVHLVIHNEGVRSGAGLNAGHIGRMDIAGSDRVLVDAVVLVCRLGVASDVAILSNASAGTGLVEIVIVVVASSALRDVAVVDRYRNIDGWSSLGSSEESSQGTRV